MEDLEFGFTIVSYNKSNKSVTIEIECEAFKNNKKLFYNIGIQDITDSEHLHNHLSEQCRLIVQQTLISQNTQRELEVENYIEENINKPIKIQITTNDSPAGLENKHKTITLPKESKQIKSNSIFEVVV